MGKMIKRKSLSHKQREAVLAKTGGRCAYCGEAITLRQMQVDHIVSIEQAHFCVGDINGADNLFPACRSCNYIKSSMSIEKFRLYVEGLPATLGRDSVTYRNAIRLGMIVDLMKPCEFYFEKLGLSVPSTDIDFIYREQHEKIWEKAAKAGTED